MAKAKFDIKSIELPAVAARPLYAGVGATDLAVEYVRDAVADVQKRFVGVQKDVQTRVADVQKNVRGFDFEPKALRSQATTVVNARVDALSKDAKARATAVQTTVNDSVVTATETYAELAKRGESTVKRLRGDLAGALDEVADDIEDAIEAVADAVDAPKTKGATKSAARRTTASKAPAKAATTSTASTAKKATPRKTTATKAPAKKTAGS